MLRNSNGQASVRTIVPLAAIGVLALAAGAYALSGSSGSSGSSTTKADAPAVTTEVVPTSVAVSSSSSTSAAAGSKLPAGVSFGGGPAVLNTGSVAPGDRGGAPVADPTATAAPRLGAPVVGTEPGATTVPPPTAAPSQTTAPGTPQPGQSLGSKPVANPDAVTAVGGEPVAFNVVANDTDPDGDLNPASVILSSKPQAGKAVLGAGGKVTYTADITFEGTDFFSYVVCDKKNNCAGNMVTITVALSPSVTTSSTDAPPPPPDGTN